MHHAWRMLVLFLKKLWSHLLKTVISLRRGFSQAFRLVKSTNCQYLSLEPKNEKNKDTLFSGTLKVSENKVVLLFLIFASRPKYWRFLLFNSLCVWKKSLWSQISVPGNWLYCFLSTYTTSSRDDTFFKWDKILQERLS